jgi:hypothetical protein
MRVACWMSKAIETYSEYVIFIAFPRQQWLRKRASMLRLYITLPGLLMRVLGTMTSMNHSVCE